MSKKDNDTTITIVDEGTNNEEVLDAKAKKKAEADKQLEETIRQIKQTAQESDPHPSQQLSLRTVLGGDFLTASFVRSQVGLVMLVVAFTIVYIAFRYQCQQDMVTIAKLENELKDAKNKSLAASSTLTEKCRESNVLNMLKQHNDTTLHIAEQPPYIIQIPE